MIRLKYFCLILMLFLFPEKSPGQKNQRPVTILVHGGAGNIRQLSRRTEELYEQKLKEALDTGYKVLERGGRSIDAVTAAVVVLENSPLFNAGRGAVLASNETVQLDASVMEGKELKAGAVTLVGTVKNPVLAAQAVMESSPYVMLGGEGAENFAHRAGLEMVDSTYFYNFQETNKDGTGTVGAVAVDQYGNVAAATSTGGISGKAPGRIGDSPVIGAGTYADNNSCAVSCTGKGEFFIRLAVAKEIAAFVELKGYTVEKAARYVIENKLEKLNGVGGVIVLNAEGDYVFVFNTEAMFRGVKTAEFSKVLIYKQ